MGCPDDNVMSRYIGGGVSAAEAHVLSAHLDGCSDCRTLAISAVGSSPVGVEGAGRYVIEGPHARGGQADIFIARDLLLDREVALKLLRDVGHADARARFEREGLVTSRLEHPSIVPLYDAGVLPDGTPYQAMRLVRGETLRRVLAEAQTPAQRLALLPNFVNVCLAVAYAHSRGVVHRDIKPANIMVGAFGETVLLDWGLAQVDGEAEPRTLPRLADSAWTTATGTRLGTPAYMSPEQARGESRVDARADVWSLGAVLHELLTGSPPARGEVPPQVEKSVAPLLAVARKALAEAPPESPPVEKSVAPLLAVARKALAEAPSERYGSADALAQDVSAFLAARAVSAYRYSAWERLGRFASRNRSALLALTGVLLALVTVLGMRVSALRTQGLALAEAKAARGRELRAKREALLNLGQAHADKADRLADEHQHLAAAVHATASAESVLASAEGEGQLSAAASELLARASGQLWDAERQPLQGLEARLAVGRRPRSLAVSPQGAAAFVTGEGMSEVVEVDLAAGRVRSRWRAHEGGVGGVELSPDGKELVTAGADHFLRRWSADTHALLREQKQERIGRTYPRYTPDGASVLATDFDGAIAVFDAQSLSLRARLLLPGHRPLVFEPIPGGRLVSGGEDHRVVLWDFKKPIRVLEGHGDWVRAVAVSPDGARIASGGLDGQVLIWDARTGARVRTLSGPFKIVTKLAFSPDGAQLAIAGTDGYVTLARVSSGEVTARFHAHAERTTTVSFTPDGQRLLTIGLDGVLNVWRLRAERPSLLQGSQGGWISLGGKGQHLIEGTPSLRNARIWHLASRTLTRTFPAHEKDLTVAVLSDDERLAVTASLDHWVRVWSTESGAEVASFDAEEQVLAAAISPEGQTVVGGTFKGNLCFWDLGSKKLRRRVSNAHALPISQLVYSRDGQLLASSSMDKTVKLWDATGEARRTFPTERHTYRVAFSPDGKLLAGAGYGGTLLWDTAGGLRAEMKGHAEEIYGLSFAREGRLLLTAGMDGTVRGWEVPSGAPAFVIRTQPSTSVAASGEELAVAACCTTELWAIPGAKPLMRRVDAERASGLTLQGFELRVSAAESSMDRVSAGGGTP